MNDKELDQILRKSLRPEVSEEELEVWDRAPRMESEHTMRRHTIIKSTVAAAACLALVAGIGYGKESGAAGHENDKDNTTECIEFLYGNSQCGRGEKE